MSLEVLNSSMLHYDLRSSGCRVGACRLFKPNNHPDEVNAKVVIAYGLVNKRNALLVGLQTSKPN